MKVSDKLVTDQITRDTVGGKWQNAEKGLGSEADRLWRRRMAKFQKVSE